MSSTATGAIIIIILSLAVTHPHSRQNCEKRGVVIRGTQSEKMTEGESALSISIGVRLFTRTRDVPPSFIRDDKSRSRARRDCHRGLDDNRE